MTYLNCDNRWRIEKISRTNQACAGKVSLPVTKMTHIYMHMALACMTSCTLPRLKDLILVAECTLYRSSQLNWPVRMVERLRWCKQSHVQVTWSAKCFTFNCFLEAEINSSRGIYDTLSLAHLKCLVNRGTFATVRTSTPFGLFNPLHDALEYWGLNMVLIIIKPRVYN